MKTVREAITEFFQSVGEQILEFEWLGDSAAVETPVAIYQVHIDTFGPIGYAVEIDHEWKK